MKRKPQSLKSMTIKLLVSEKKELVYVLLALLEKTSNLLLLNEGAYCTKIKRIPIARVTRIKDIPSFLAAFSSSSCRSTN